MAGVFFYDLHFVVLCGIIVLMTTKDNERQTKEALLLTVRKVSALYKATEPLTEEYLVGVVRFLYALHQYDKDLVKGTVAVLVKNQENPFLPRLSDYINAAVYCIKRDFQTAEEVLVDMAHDMLVSGKLSEKYDNHIPAKAALAAIGGWQWFGAHNFGMLERQKFESTYNRALDEHARDIIETCIGKVVDYALEEYLEL